MNKEKGRRVHQQGPTRQDGGEGRRFFRTDTLQALAHFVYFRTWGRKTSSHVNNRAKTNA